MGHYSSGKKERRVRIEAIAPKEDVQVYDESRSPGINEPSSSRKEPPSTVAGYKPEAILKAPVEPPSPSDAEGTSRHAQEVRWGHSILGLSLVMVGVGLLIITVLAIAFLPDWTGSPLAIAAVLGVIALIAGVVIDTVYRRSYDRGR